MKGQPKCYKIKECNYIDPISLSHLKYFFIPSNPKHAYLVTKNIYMNFGQSPNSESFDGMFGGTFLKWNML
jgi:hypothetical protein